MAASWFSRNAGRSTGWDDRGRSSRDAGAADSEPPGDRGARGRARRVILFVFGVVLPSLIDYDAVRAALAALTPGQLGLLVATSVVAYVANAGPTRVLVPGLSWPRAVGSDLAARAVVSTVPGPTDIATRLVLYRQWAIPTAIASAGSSSRPYSRRCLRLPCR